MSYLSAHNHTDASNFRLRDAINKVESLADYMHELGLEGFVVTDHEALSNHVKLYKYVEKMKKEGKFREDFKVGFGNEIYLVDRSVVEEKRPLNERIPFHHFLLIAKNQQGFEALKEMSSKAWKDSFYYKGIERVPTYKDYLEDILLKYPGSLIASTACVGGELPQLLIKYHHSKSQEDKVKVHNFISWLKRMFGSDLYFELQPSRNEDQLIANKMLIEVGEKYNVKCIVTTDSHYLNKAAAKAHESYLKASEGEREVAEFYATTYVMAYEELLEYFDEETLSKLCKNTLEIKEKLEPITFEQETKVPKVTIPEYEMNVLFEGFYDDYEYIKKYYHSEVPVDRYYLHLISNGLMDKDEEINHENLSRIDLELKEVYLTSIKRKQPISAYFVATKDIIDIMWELSLIGVSRGSASCFYTNYLLDIVQINPIKYNLPHWRFLSAERPSMPDIDIDSEGSKRQSIITKVKEEYGEDNVLNMGTLTTEGSRSTVLTACRGLGIDNDLAQNIANLIPTEKGGVWTIEECFYGNEKKNKKPAAIFISEVENYEGLKEAMFHIEGIISGRGQHASGVVIFPEGYTAQNSLMKTTSGLPVTQFEAPDTEYMGGLKFDFLSINALDRIRAAMELLIEYGKIEWQGTLKKTYIKYFHPDVLDMTSPEMFEMLRQGEVFNAFQFETPVGQSALRKIQASTFEELCAGNSLMRLSSDGEQPLDRFIKFKNNPNLWDLEMREFGLNDEEIDVLKRHLSQTYGVCDTQEGLMLLSMEPKISGFTLEESNKFRKAVAKQDQKVLGQQKVIFYKKGEEIGTRKVMLDYVWEKELKPQFGYAFSSPHIAGYTLILMIEMNICFRYGSIFWKTACLSVNAGLIGESVDGGVAYGEIAKAVGALKGLVYSPDINKSKLGFTPLEEEGKILYGLKPISGLGADACDIIIQNRPYASFEDFHERIVQTNLLSPGKVVSLIKAGCFDLFNPNRVQLMTDFVRMITPKKTKLTMTNLPYMIQFADREKFEKQISLFEFKNKIMGRHKVQMDKSIEVEFIKNYSKDVKYKFEDGNLLIDEKSFNKYYGEKMELLKEWLISPETAERFNKSKMREYWVANCLGNKESWEMESIAFYTDKHELDLTNLKDPFNVENFFEMNEEPETIGWKTMRNGKRRPVTKISVIAGTVISKNKGRALIDVSTQYGVVTVRYNKGQFAHYDKKIVRVNGKDKEVVDTSWFERGTKLVLVGFRRGEEFVLRTTDTHFDHTTYKIQGYNKDKIWLQNTKAGE